MRVPAVLRGWLLPLVLLSGASAWGQAQPSVVGQWTDLLDWPDNATHVMLLPTGEVLSWPDQETPELHLWDPATSAHRVAANPGYNLFCAGHALLADGRLLVTGGHRDSNEGLKHASLYDPFSDTWTRLPDMNAGRWYPTNTALPSGEMLVIAGTSNGRRVGENRLPQVWQPSLGTWRDLTGAQRALRTYPWMFVVPSGKLFMAGPDPVAGYLDTAGAGAWELFAPSLFGDRFAGSAVMYDVGKVMVSGGGEEVPTATVEVIDLNGASPAWRSVTPMGSRRKQHNMTLLPDGTVLVTGGSSGPGKDDDTHPVFATELWDPATERFTLLAPSRRYRGYHSNALLLPDGRVLSLGGVDFEDAQLFSPPYLFRGPRPTISRAPAGVGYGERFSVTTPDAASISGVTLLAPGSATHAYNQGQRISRLAFTRGAGAVRVTAPPSSSHAPPGFYMLFLLDERGVPSVARWVKLGGSAPASPGEAWPEGETPGTQGRLPVTGGGCAAASAPSTGGLLLALAWVARRLRSGKSGHDDRGVPARSVSGTARIARPPSRS